MTDFYSFRKTSTPVIRIEEPEVELSIIKRLGKPKFWVSENDFDIIMGKIYKTASKRARELYYAAIEEDKKDKTNQG